MISVHLILEKIRKIKDTSMLDELFSDEGSQCFGGTSLILQKIIIRFAKNKGSCLEFVTSRRLGSSLLENICSVLKVYKSILRN